MIRNLNKTLNKFSLFFQPITKKPYSSSSKISDLFFWRVDENWRTYFDLLNIVSIMGGSSKKAEIIFFDQNGFLLFREEINLNGLSKKTLDIAYLLGKNNIGSSISFGTFAIFHLSTPEIIFNSNSYLSDRGYVSYKYRSSNLRKYVHGNYDAVAKGENSLKMLTGSSFFKRKYNLQYSLERNSNYEIVIINSTSRNQKMTLDLSNGIDSKPIFSTFELPIRALKISKLSNLDKNSHLPIKSNMTMSRPIVFSYRKNDFDVFHG